MKSFVALAVRMKGTVIPFHGKPVEAGILIRP